MESLKIDRTKLKTVSNYAKMMGVTSATVRNWIQEKKIKSQKIDGVQFIDLG